MQFKWKSPFRFLPTGIFGTTSGGGPLISVGIFRPKFVVPFLTNRFFALIRELRGETNSGKSHSYWLARFNRKCRSILLGNSHRPLTGRFLIMESTHRDPEGARSHQEFRELRVLASTQCSRRIFFCHNFPFVSLLAVLHVGAWRGGGEILFSPETAF